MVIDRRGRIGTILAVRATYHILVTTLLLLSVVALGWAQSRRHVDRTSRLICALSMHDSEHLRDADDADDGDEVEDQPIIAHREVQKIKPPQRKTLAAMPLPHWRPITRHDPRGGASVLPAVPVDAARLTLLDLRCALRT